MGKHKKPSMLPPPPPSIKLTTGLVTTAQNKSRSYEGLTRSEMNTKSSKEYSNKTNQHLNVPKPSVETIDNWRPTGLEELNRLIRPPSPSVLELAVPPKPAPVVIDLLADDPIEADTCDPSSTQPVTLGPALAMYSRLFPVGIILSVDEVKWTCHDVLLKHEISWVDSSPPFNSIALKAMVVNYFNHMVKHQQELDRFVAIIQCSRANAEGVWNTFGEGNSKTANAHMSKRLGQLGSTPGPPDTWGSALPQLLAGQTRLQRVLSNKYSEVPAGIIRSDELLWEILWTPINLTMCFELFTHTVSKVLDIHHALPTLLRLYKKGYMDYMDKVAESNQEFVLAVVSAFGTGVGSYPGRVLEMLQLRGLFKDGYQLPEWGVNDPLVKNNKDSIVSQRNAVIAENLRREMIQSRRNEPPVTKVPLLKDCHKLSLERFAPVAQQIWSWFYGNRAYISDAEVTKWYHSFDISTKTDSLLKSCLFTLASDNLQMKGGIKKISAQEEKIFRDKFELQVKQQRSTYVLTNSSNALRFTTQMVMESKTSLLQLSLLANSTVPSLNGWAPQKCVMPYGLFKALFEARLKWSGTTLKLCEDAIKVRYVEFMSHAFRTNVSQILLAIFNAVGPDLANVPLRILYILQETRLFNRILGLPTCYYLQNDVYAPLDQNFRSKRPSQSVPQPQPPAKRPTVAAKPAANTNTSVPQSLPSSKTVAIAPQPLSTNTRLPGLLSFQPASNGPSPPKASKSATESPEIAVIAAIKGKWDQPPASWVPRTLPDWTSLATEALSIFRLPALSSSACRDTFSRHLNYLTTPLGLRDPDFMKGVLAGIALCSESLQWRGNTASPQAHAWGIPNAFSDHNGSGQNHAQVNTGPPSFLQGNMFQPYLPYPNGLMPSPQVYSPTVGYVQYPNNAWLMQPPLAQAQVQAVPTPVPVPPPTPTLYF